MHRKIVFVFSVPKTFTAHSKDASAVRRAIDTECSKLIFFALLI